MDIQSPKAPIKPYITLFSYPGGCGGEFLAGLISRDSHYYDLALEPHERNRWRAANPLEFIGQNLQAPWCHYYQPTQQDLQTLDQARSELHLLIPTHHYEAEDTTQLPRLKRLRVYTDRNWFWYTLLWIKHLATGAWLASARRRGLKTAQQLIIQDYETWSQWNKQVYPGWQRLDIDGLVSLDPEVVDHWQMSLDLAEPLDLDRIAEYHKANCELIEQHFGPDYASDWFRRLYLWAGDLKR